MAWDKPDNSTISFECDSCSTVEDCDIERVKLGATDADSPHVTEFMFCWRYLQGCGWVSFKRTGKPWSYHCTKCADQAKQEYQEWNRNDRERERLKSRNAQ